MILMLILLAVVILLIVSGVSFILDSRKTNIKGPLTVPILGNGHLFLGDNSMFLRRAGSLEKEYGGTVLVYILSTRHVFMTDPRHFEPLLTSSEQITKGRTYDVLHPWLGQGLLTSSGDKWRTHRKLLTPAFHFNILQSFLPIFLKNQRILIRNLQQLADGSPFDLFPVMALVALDNVTESAMGVSINAQEDRDSKYLKSINIISEISMTRMINPIMATNMIFNLLPHKKKQDEALKILHGHTERVIEERRQLLEESKVTLANYSEFGIKKRNSFLDLLLLSEVNGERLDMQSIREEVDTFMFEGHDTTTTALCFILYCIANNEGIDEKILHEQRSILDDDLNRDPTYSDIQQMKYLDLVIKESLRLFPSVPLIARRLTRDIDIAGFKYLKNTEATIDIFHMQRDPAYYEDPMEFRPERFTTANANQKYIYNWIAFSAGPRNCIGQKFAMVQLKVIISSIIKNFKVLSSGVEPILSSDLVLRSKNGVQVKMIPRT